MEKEENNNLNEHALCFMLTVRYLADMMENLTEKEINRDFSRELDKYQRGKLPLGTYSGRTWIVWFLKEFVPKKLKEQNGRR